jgi:hypothetical protein
MAAGERPENCDRSDRCDDERKDLHDRRRSEQGEQAGDNCGYGDRPKKEQARREDLSDGEQDGRNGPQQPGWHRYESYGVRTSLRRRGEAAHFCCDSGTSGVGPRS